MLIKYKNRKIYNTEISRYVSLDDIILMIRNGENVTVKCKESGNDITLDILKQVLPRCDFSLKETVNLIKKQE